MGVRTSLFISRTILPWFGFRRGVVGRSTLVLSAPHPFHRAPVVPRGGEGHNRVGHRARRTAQRFRCASAAHSQTPGVTGHGQDILSTPRGMTAPEGVVANWPCSATMISLRSRGCDDGETVADTRDDPTSLRT